MIFALIYQFNFKTHDKAGQLILINQPGSAVYQHEFDEHQELKWTSQPDVICKPISNIPKPSLKFNEIIVTQPLASPWAISVVSGPEIPGQLFYPKPVKKEVNRMSATATAASHIEFRDGFMILVMGE